MSAPPEPVDMVPVDMAELANVANAGTTWLRTPTAEAFSEIAAELETDIAKVVCCYRIAVPDLPCGARWFSYALKTMDKTMLAVVRNRDNFKDEFGIDAFEQTMHSLIWHGRPQLQPTMVWIGPCDAQTIATDPLHFAHADCGQWIDQTTGRPEGQSRTNTTQKMAAETTFR